MTNTKKETALPEYAHRKQEMIKLSDWQKFVDVYVPASKIGFQHVTSTTFHHAPQIHSRKRLSLRPHIAISNSRRESWQLFKLVTF